MVRTYYHGGRDRSIGALETYNLCLFQQSVSSLLSDIPLFLAESNWTSYQ
jgi:hypothetical protein